MKDNPDTAVRPVRRHFDEFYRNSRDGVARALVLTLGNQELGVEATDEGMTRAYQRWDQISNYDNPEGWVYRVGLNWARSIWRKRRREVQDVYEPAPVIDKLLDVDVDRALANIDVRFRSVVVLRLYLDWSIDTTAEALGVQPGTVKSRMSRAMERLEKELGGDPR
ncbi:MAG: sigma factor-like helix-turn-helix DNA-binding protein [Acidimicrobiia bacterium]|nr:sigma factor-like helix-turn-helix DNA-binding protein [Acidimicrobiia bacterium]MDX2466403.1 sigma factor-like helix-turn-helix DNA-binding protein [Acidimicrobiia bacterium]